MNITSVKSMLCMGMWIFISGVCESSNELKINYHSDNVTNNCASRNPELLFSMQCQYDSFDHFVTLNTEVWINFELILLHWIMLI